MPRVMRMRSPGGETGGLALLVAVLVLLGALAAVLIFPAAETPAFPGARPAAAATPFATNVVVTDGTTGYPQHVEPTLVVAANGDLTVGWKEALTPEGAGQRVAYARSVDGGATWSANALKGTTAPGLEQSDPWLVLDAAGGLHYASLEYSSDNSISGVTVTSSADGGRTWSGPVQADDRGGFADKEAMTSDGSGTLYLVYDDVLGPDYATSESIDLLITRSVDGGATWSPTVSVTGAPGNILGPVVAARPDGRVVVAWWNLAAGDVLASASTDRGATWTPAVRVNAVPGSAVWVNSSWETAMPSIAQDASGRLYVAWADLGAGTRDILVSRSDDGGATWSSSVRVNDVATGDQWMPSLVVDPRGTVHAAWLDGRTGAWNAEYANSTDGGLTWSANVRVSTAGTSLGFARPGDYLALAADANGTAYVAWTDGRSGSLAIEFARSTPKAVPAPNGTPPPTAPFPWAAVAAVAGGMAVVAGGAAVVLLRRRKRGLRERGEDVPRPDSGGRGGPGPPPGPPP